MKSIYPYALLGALFAVGAASAATTTTTPVGYVSLGDTTAGQPAVKANTDSIISIPLARESDFTGTAASVAGSVVTVAGTPAWTSTQFTATPYYFVVTGGAQQGLIGLVTANTTNTVTVSTVAGSLAGVDATSTVVLTKAWTLGTFLPTGANIPNGTQLLAFDGVGVGVNLASSQIYTMTGAGWFQTFPAGASAANVVLYPGESFILRTGASPIPTLVTTGTVPKWIHRTPISKLSATKGQDNRISYFAPVGEAIGSASIPALNGDTFLIFDNTAAGKNKSAVKILTKTSAGWFGTFGAGAGTNQDSFLIGGGAGYVLRRAVADPVGDVDWSDAPTYLPNL